MSSVQWGDVPTWLTAIATFAAAVGAFIAARIAFNQLKGQRAEIERQSGEQARIAELQTVQLEQLKQQAELNARQITRLDQQAEALRRGQAEGIGAVRSCTSMNITVGRPQDYEGVTVTNKSGRPIRGDVVHHVGSDGAISLPLSQQLEPFRPGPTNVAPRLPSPTSTPVVRTDEALYVLWSQPYNASEPFDFRIQFKDDAGNGWELDQDMHLVDAPHADW